MADEQCELCGEPGRRRFTVSSPLPSLAGMQFKVGATSLIACDGCWAKIRKAEA